MAVTESTAGAHEELLTNALAMFYDGQEFGAKILIAFEIMEMGYSEDVAAEAVTRISMNLAYQQKEMGFEEVHGMIVDIALAQLGDAERLG